MRVLLALGAASLDVALAITLGLRELIESGKVRAADHTFRIPLARLAPGSYLLTFAAGDGRHSARQDVRFIVR